MLELHRHRFQQHLPKNSVKTSFMMLLSLLVEGTTFFDQGVDLALEGCFQQVGDEVVEVGICQTVSQRQSVFDEDRQTGVPSSR